MSNLSGISYVAPATVNSSFYTTNSTSVLTVDGSNHSPSLSVNGALIVNGKDIEERLAVIEKVLGLPERDLDLEKKYPKLKKLYNEYVEELAKYRTWDILSK